jgi:CBS domain-containing protein
MVACKPIQEILKNDERRSVLVAEDDPDVRARLVSALRADGYHVVIAGDSEACLSRLSRSVMAETFEGKREDRIDLVFCDVEPPETTWADIFTGLREAEWQVPVILVEGSEEEEEEAFMTAGRLDRALVFQKPLSISRIRDAVSELLSERTGEGEDAPIPVRTVMQPEPLTLSRWSTVAQATRLAQDAGVHHLLVMDGGSLVGVLCVCKLWGAAADGLVATHMIPHVISIGPDVSIAEAALVMHGFEIGCLPVMVNGRLVGMVTREDLDPLLSWGAVAPYEHERRRLAGHIGRRGSGN